MKKMKFMMAGMLILAFMTGCGSDDNHAKQELNSTISEDMEDTEQNMGEPESRMEESGQSQSEVITDDMEKELTAYRTEREKGTSVSKTYTMVQLPNEENYNYNIGDSSYVSRFDSKELNEAFRTAREYVEGTLNLESDIWQCIDPRMTAIYEEEDKGSDWEVLYHGSSYKTK